MDSVDGRKGFPLPMPKNLQQETKSEILRV